MSGLPEQFDVVNLDDKPTGALTTKKDAHANNIPHRIAAVLVFSSPATMLVQVHKKHWRLMDHAVGGHVATGESYEEAARREMEEELGLDLPLEKIAESVLSREFYKQSDHHLTHFIGVFTAKIPKNWKHKENDEVDQIIEMNIHEIEEQMRKNPERFLQGFIVSFKTWINARNA